LRINQKETIAVSPNAAARAVRARSSGAVSRSHGHTESVVPATPKPSSAVEITRNPK